ncbi:opacity family porin [Eikenella sp. Marseille-P7795]|uniref:opacity family porin n=1 Tax=Eikenella sp. Marseille-P7795 TaxID=2866577 RepID=UPI001CE437D5|nr:opacity family porin [Eikenella sp. Marseille-P7795]
MKKALAALIALSLSGLALADDNRGFYVQGDLGHASVKGEVYGESATAKGFSPRVSFGYDFGDFRVAADYTHYKSRSESGRISSSTSYDAEAKFQSLGVSAIYDFDLGAPVKPYAGARLGLNRVSFDTTERGTGGFEHYETRKTKAGVGILAGVGYDITQSIALDAGYRYNYWGKFDGVKVDSHEVSAGVRVKF